MPKSYKNQLLEKIADYIVFIHNGEIILNKTKDELIYEYGVIRCSENDFHNMLTLHGSVHFAGL